MGMANLIDRDSLMAQLEDRKAFLVKEWGYRDHYARGFDEAVDTVDNAPTVDAVEVVHGRWEEADDGDGLICSVCREDFCNIYLETDRFNYCPNCGAKMDLKGE